MSPYEHTPDPSRPVGNAQRAATGKAGVVRPVTHSLSAPALDHDPGAAGLPAVAGPSRDEIWAACEANKGKVSEAAMEWAASVASEVMAEIGPNDLFEVASNNSPDPEDDDDTVIEPQDYTGDYPLEGEDGDEEGD